MPAEDDRPAEPDSLVAVTLEARSLGGRDDLRERAPGDVHPGLDQKQEAAGFQDGQDLGEKPFAVGDLVGHPEGQREIGLQVDSQSVLAAEVQADTAGDSGPLGPFPRFFEHALMDIHGHDQAALSNPPGHGNSEETGAAADVDGDIPFPEEPGQDPVRVVSHPPEGICQQEGQPRRTNMLAHHGPISGFRIICRIFAKNKSFLFSRSVGSPGGKEQNIYIAK
jgi:hypothetical protein